MRKGVTTSLLLWCLALAIGASADDGFNGKSWNWWEKQLRDKNPAVVRRVACGLRELGPEGGVIVPAMQVAYAQADVPARVCLIKGLIGSAKDSSLGPFFLQATKDSFPDVRAEALRGLGQVAEAMPETAAAVVAALSDNDLSVVLAAVKAVPRVTPPPHDAVLPLLRIRRSANAEDKWLINAVDRALEPFAADAAVIADMARRAADAARPFRVMAPNGAERLPQIDCVEEWFSATPHFIVKHIALPGRPVGGQFGKGSILGGEDMSVVSINATGELRVDIEGQKLRPGEPVVVRHIRQSSRDRGARGEKDPQPVGIQVNTLLKHNVTRGRGQFEHQSAETFALLLWLPTLECAALKDLWDRFFTVAPPDSVQKVLAKSPSGVIVDEISEGMSPAEVEAVLGPPERKAQIAGKDIYFYPRMKVTFRAGKVVDIE